MIKNDDLPELTLRGCIIAALLTVVFTAANVYFGLKAGLTFATSIPAAIISMSVLRFFSKSNILENCTVQTFASSAGTITSIIYVLPALIMLGYWSSFPYWQTALLCVIGGVLGVMFTIPLRRTLVVGCDLPYPEGVAAAKVLAIGNDQQAGNHLPRTDAKDIWYGTVLSVLFPLFSAGFGLLGETLRCFFTAGGMVFGFAMQYSPALMGAGYLIGIRAGLAILLGLVISWGIAVPYFSSLQALPDAGSLVDIAYKIWSTKSRFIGVGAMAVAAVWTICSLLPALLQGLRSSIRDLRLHNANKAQKIVRTERDIPITYVLGISLLLIIPTFLLFYYFIQHAHLPVAGVTMLGLVIACTVFVFVLGFAIATVCGYMAGIIGSSCAPMSGIAILTILCSALLLVYFFNHWVPGYSVELTGKSLMALGIFMGSFVTAIAAISNDNLQDLKTGQIVGATPWRQQVALVFGVLAGGMVIPSIITLMYQAYGFLGSPMPRPGMDPTAGLSAPQAAMMTELARGIVLQHGQWGLLGVGALISTMFIAVDVLVFKPLRWPRLSVLAVAMGLYLPIHIDLAIVLGTVISYVVRRKLHRQYGDAEDEIMCREHRGTSFASGLILGETLLGIVFAGVIVTTGDSHPWSFVGANFAPIASVLGLVVFTGLCWRFYTYIVR